MSDRSVSEAALLARERRAQEEQETADRIGRLQALSQQAEDAAAAAPRAKRKSSPGPAETTGSKSEAPTSTRKPRYLVDPTTLTVINAAGTVVPGTRRNRRSTQATPTHSAVTTSTGNAPVNLEKPPPKHSTTYRAYSDEEKERLALEIASRVLAGDERALRDIRNQRNVGADAVDDLRRFYELKTFAGEELDTVTLEPAQIRLAMTEPDFFLVIVSNLEGKTARPKVRVIVDPLRQLVMKQTSKVQFSGITEADSLIFHMTSETSEPKSDIPAATD